MKKVNFTGKELEGMLVKNQIKRDADGSPVDKETIEVFQVHPAEESSVLFIKVFDVLDEVKCLLENDVDELKIRRRVMYKVEFDHLKEFDGY